LHVTRLEAKQDSRGLWPWTCWWRHIDAAVRSRRSEGRGHRWRHST